MFFEKKSYLIQIFFFEKKTNFFWKKYFYLKEKNFFENFFEKKFLEILFLKNKFLNFFFTSVSPGANLRRIHAPIKVVDRCTIYLGFYQFYYRQNTTIPS